MTTPRTRTPYRHSETFPSSAVVTLTADGLRIVHRSRDYWGGAVTRVVIYDLRDGTVQVHPTAKGIRVSCPGNAVGRKRFPWVTARSIWHSNGWGLHAEVQRDPAQSLDWLTKPAKRPGIGVGLLPEDLLTVV